MITKINVIRSKQETKKQKLIILKVIIRKQITKIQIFKHTQPNRSESTIQFSNLFSFQR